MLTRRTLIAGLALTPLARFCKPEPMTLEAVALDRDGNVTPLKQAIASYDHASGESFTGTVLVDLGTMRVLGPVAPD